MTRHDHARTIVLLGVVCLLASGASAQSLQRYGLSSNASIVGGRKIDPLPLRVEPDGTAREFVQVWQVYRGDMAEVEFAISLSNTGADTLYFNSGIIERAMRVRLFSMTDGGEPLERPVTLTMRGVLETDGSGPFVTLPDQLLLAEGMDGDPLLAEGRKTMVVWIVAATQPDGRPFAPGRYRFELEQHDIRSAIVTAQGGPLPDEGLRPWSGVTRGHLELRITAPSTPAEVAAMYVQRGVVAFDRTQFEEAATLYRQAVDVHPADAGGALHLLGGTYLKMGRYAEAIPVLQRLPIQGQKLVQAYLAEAYVGVGNEAEAMNLLRRNGWPEADVAARIDDLRARVRSTPRR
jgi:hypothetical protein